MDVGRSDHDVVQSSQRRDEEAYPRPDFRRTNLHWQSLNGAWDVAFDDDDIMSSEWHKHGGKRKIQVPFVFQSQASDINMRGLHEVLWYHKYFSVLEENENALFERGDRLILCFGAVDYFAKVWVDGNFVGEHRGGHVPFDFDITDELSETVASDKHIVIVRVYDSAHDLTQPRGKQYWGPQPESIFYTPSSGIWQSVWVERVPRLRIADSSHGTIIRSHNIEEGKLDVRIALQGRSAREKCSVELEASLYGVVVSNSGRKEVHPDENFVRFDQNVRLSADQLRQLPQRGLVNAPIVIPSCWENGVALWSPEYPILYDLKIRLYGSAGQMIDEMQTTTGMRSLNWTTGDGTFRLNGRPYFQTLVLDQGYWPSTLMTAPSQESLKQDIILAKAMGFNGCRKHQKVEDPVFMYWADRLGFLVWGEMASAYHFSVDYVDRFNEEWMAMVKRDINHPCVVAWTPANESWGYPDLANNVRQRDHLRSLYYMTKTLDWTRPVNDNCGWEHVVTDLSTFHDYADAPGMAERCQSIQSVLGRGKGMFLGPIHGHSGAYDEGSKHERGAPILCTEFGGVNISGGGSDPERRENWGYTTAKDSEDLLRRVEDIVMATVQPGVVCGMVWTQFTDIEQEQNGLYTWDRQPKLPADQVKAIMERAKQAYHSHHT